MKELLESNTCPNMACEDLAGNQLLQPSATSAPTTQKQRGRHQVPRLPRNRCFNVIKCHACHAKCRCVRATPATHLQRGCHQAPCLPWTSDVDVTKYQATWMSPSTLPATQSAGVTADQGTSACERKLCDKVVCERLVSENGVCEKVVSLRHSA